MGAHGDELVSRSVGSDIRRGERRTRGGVDEHQAVDALGVERGEQLGDESTLGHAEQRCRTQTSGVHDCSDVKSTLLESGRLLELV